MTLEQQTLTIRILQFGFATGAATRFDCLRSFITAYPDLEAEALTAMAEFERGCCYFPEQAEDKAALTVEEFKEWVGADA